MELHDCGFPELKRRKGLIYQQLAGLFEGHIRGNLKPGERFFPEKKLAEHFGVSTLTVARAIGALVNKGLLERRQGSGTYATAQAGVVSDPVSVGVVVAHLDSSFFGEITAGVEEMAFARGCRLMFCNSADDPEKERMHLLNLANIPAVRGIIVEAGRVTARNSFWKESPRVDKPVVLVNTQELAYARDLVYSNDEDGVHAVTLRLHAAGYRRLFFLCDHDDDPNFKMRESGFLRAVRGLGLDAADAKPIHGVETLSPGIAEVVEAAVGPLEELAPAAFISCSDQIAVTMLNALSRRGFAIPKDFAVVGYGNLDIGRYSNPSLSTVSQSSYEMGRKALELLLDRCANPDRPLREVIIPPKLISRESAPLGS